MDYRLLYSQRSLNDLGEILGHIAEEDAEGTSRFGSSLLDHVDLLSRFPRLGGLIRKRSRVRKLLHSPLLVYYRVDEDKKLIEILHVRHGARKEASDVELGALPGRLAHGERSHATRDPRGVREYLLGALPRTSFRAPAALIISRNAGLGSPCASRPVIGELLAPCQLPLSGERKG